jgi:hypothetical protein
MWGNPMREREIYYSASGKYISTTITQFPAKRKTTYNTQKLSQKFLPRFLCQVRTVVRTHPENMHLKIMQTVVVRTVLYNPTKKNAQNNPRKLCQHLPRFSCPLPLLYGLYGSVQYDLPTTVKNEPSTQTKIPPWDLCPSFLGKCALLVALFPLSSLLRKSLKLLLSMCLAHYPMHSFIKSENDLFPPKCLFTFPNPKSKGQDLILPLQDQGP